MALTAESKGHVEQFTEYALSLFERTSLATEEKLALVVNLSAEAVSGANTFAPSACPGGLPSAIEERRPLFGLHWQATGAADAPVTDC